MFKNSVYKEQIKQLALVIFHRLAFSFMLYSYKQQSLVTQI